MPVLTTRKPFTSWLHSQRDPLFLGVLSLFCNLFAIDWGLPHHINAALSASDIDWGPDSLAPLGPLAYAKRLLYNEAWFNKYPPLHFQLLALLYSPYIAYLSLKGEFASPTDLYPYGLLNPEAALSSLTFIARWASAMMGTGVVLVNYYTVKKLFDRRAGLISSLLIAFSYPIIHYAHNANLDIPHIFWLSLALYTVVSLEMNPKPKYYLLLGVFSACTIATKESSSALLIGLIPSFLWSHIKRFNTAKFSFISLRQLVLHKDLLSCILSFTISLILIFNPMMNYDGLVYHFDYHTMRSISGSWTIRDAPTWLDGNLALIGNYLLYILQSVGYFGFISMLAGSFYSIIKYPHLLIKYIVPIVTYYFLFLSLHGTHHLRYILPVYILLTWLAAKFLSDFLDHKSMSSHISKLVIFLIISSSLFHGFSVNLLYMYDSRYDVEKWMTQNLPPDGRILGVGPTYSLPRIPNDKHAERIDIWNYNGDQIRDIDHRGYDYIIINMSRQPMRDKGQEVYRFFMDRGFADIARFKSQVPFYIKEIPDLHAINPLIVIFGRIPG